MLPQIKEPSSESGKFVQYLHGESSSYSELSSGTRLGTRTDLKHRLPATSENCYK